MASKYKIIVNNSKCTGCLTCALECSFVRQKLFNPMNAYIQISSKFDKLCAITFTDECDNCCICARKCPYGALTIVR